MIANYTTIEQSKALLEAGLSPLSANDTYRKNPVDGKYFWSQLAFREGHDDGEEILPCWSATELLALLPDHITICETGRARKQYHLEISKYEPWNYGVCYVYGFYPDESVLKETGGENLLDALVEMLCWVMDNHYEDTETQSEIINEK